MNTEQFLRLTTPSKGLKILAELVNVPGRDKPGWRYTTYQSIEQMAEAALQLDAKGRTIYHACNGFGDWHPHPKKPGKRQIRDQGNVVACRALYDDIDVGEEGCYATRKEAAAALRAFLKSTKLPTPYVIASGGGLHLYWPFDRDVAPQDWQRMADKKRLITKHYGLKIDTACDTDLARVLRPVGTTWRKKEARTVTCAFSGTITDPDQFEALLDDCIALRKIEVPASKQAIPEWMVGTKGNLDDMVTEFAPTYLEVIAEHCAQIRNFKGTGADEEPLWHACAGVAKYCADGEAKFHEWSASHQGYNKTEAQEKLDNWTAKPTTCDQFKKLNASGCKSCKHTCKSPIVLGYAKDKSDDSMTRLSSKAGMILFSDAPPPRRDFTIGDIMLMAKACLLAGFGGVSKTQWLFQAAACIALGLPFMGKATMPGGVLLLLGEEDQGEVSRRFNAIAKTMELTPAQIEIVRQRVRAFPMVGLDMRLTHFVGGSLEGTGFAAEILKATLQLEAGCGLAVRMIGLDHAGLIHGGEFNTREDVVQTMRQVNHVAHESGAAVLVLAHSPKAAAAADKSTAGDVAGSTAWVDHARAALVLRAMNDEAGKRYGIVPDDRKMYISLTVVKNNYGPPNDEYWLSRESVPTYGVGVLKHVKLYEPDKAQNGYSSKLRREICELVREKTCLTKNAVEGHASAKDGRIRASKAKVSTELETMLADGVLVLRQPTAEERKRMGIKSKTDGFLCIGEGTNHQCCDPSGGSKNG